MSKSFDISFNNPLYRERLIEDRYFDNPYLDIVNELFVKTPVGEKGGTLVLYSREDKQESSELSTFGSDPKQLKDGIAACNFLLKFSLERAFGDIEYRNEEVVKKAEKAVMKNLSEVVYRDYLLKGINEIHTKSTPVEIKVSDDFFSKIKEARSKLHLTPNKIAMSARTANDLINSDKGIQKKIETYRLPEFDEANMLRLSLGIEPFIFELPEDTTYDGYIYLLHSARDSDIYSKSVGLRNFVYHGNSGGGHERASFYDGKFARRYYQERGGVNGKHYAQFSVIGQLKVDNPNLFAVLKLSSAKSLPKAYASS
ncbi:hypothetical protein [Candidatus Borreliella tachyglossi]|uniref:hypothetical protein n=1 Tax=Candidatus Borreliella tachyglossi TaxID=1964448 RepID=UPI00404344A8